MKTSASSTFIRRTISVSQELDEAIAKFAEREFCGNASAFIAHCVIQYITCRACRNADSKPSKPETISPLMAKRPDKIFILSNATSAEKFRQQNSFTL